MGKIVDMKNKHSILDIIKSEKDYSLIISILLLLIFYKRTLLGNYFSFSQELNIILCFCVIGLSIIFFLLDIKNYKFTLYHGAFFVYLLICIVSSKSYISDHDYFSTIFVEVMLLGFTYSLYFLTPKKNYSQLKSNKIKLFKIILIVSVLLIDIFSLFTGEKNGITIHKNSLGSINVIAIMSVVSLIDFKKKILNIPIIVAILFCLFMIFYSDSRSSMLISILFLLIYLAILLFNNLKNKAVFLIGSLFLILLMIILIILFKDSIVTFIFRDVDIETFKDNPLSILSGRYYLWTDRLKLAMKHNKLFGHGIDTYIFTSSNNLDFIYTRLENVSFLHNIILDAYYSSGIFGLIYFMISIIGFIVYIIKRIKLKNKNNILSLLIIISLFIYFMFDTYFVWERFLPNLLFFVEICNISNEVLKNE